MSALDERTRRTLVWGFVVVLGVAHYDFWFWHDATLVAGFLPVGLAYHALISVLAAAAWALVVRYGWPSWIEDWASRPADADEREPPAPR